MPGFGFISTGKILKTLYEASHQDGGEIEGAGLLQPGEERSEGRPTSSPSTYSDHYGEHGKDNKSERCKLKDSLLLEMRRLFFTVKIIRPNKALSILV